MSDGGGLLGRECGVLCSDNGCVCVPCSKDPEQRFRHRYLDLMVNEGPRNVLITRAKVDSFIRRWFDSRDFISVQTPMLNTLAGGATARPFVTHHNELDMKMYLRVAPELVRRTLRMSVCECVWLVKLTSRLKYLKELVVGGLHRVYEMGRQFRNEGCDLTHNPEFTSLEFYQAFADMYDLMDMSEDLVSELVYHIFGSYTTTWHDKEGTAHTINWQKPWRRIPMIPTLEEIIGERFPPAETLQTADGQAFLRRILKQQGVECTSPLTSSRMLDALVGEYLESQCTDPTFIGRGALMSPTHTHTHQKKWTTVLTDA